MNVKMFGEICDAFGPSGFEEDVIRTVAKYCKGLELENDAMNNLYARMPGEDPEKPVVMLDAHTDECGFMVQSIRENGSLEILMLGGVILTNLPAHTVMIRTRSGKLVRGIISSKPIHFMNEAERASQSLSIETLSVDVGAVSRKEVTEVFGISIGDPAVPEVSFSYDEERDLCFGKAFDNRAGCACIIDTMTRLCGEKDQLAVRVTGAFAAQEEVGTRGATVTSQIVRPDLAIVFEGSPSDDFYFSAAQTQGHMRGGVQIRRMDKSYISNPADGWEMGAYGIRTPVLERAALIRPEALDLVLVPCTAFDAVCRRVGMGKGYYDRYLPRCRNAVALGVAFEAQRVPEAAADEQDRQLDGFVTERKVYRGTDEFEL